MMTTILNEAGDEREVTIVVVDELDSGAARVSWRSPAGQGAVDAHVGDTVILRAPRGAEHLELLAVATTSCGDHAWTSPAFV